MKSAFRKFNFDRYEYTLDKDQNIEHFEQTNALENGGAILSPSSAGIDSLERMFNSAELTEAAASEEGMLDGSAGKDLILIEAFPQEDKNVYAATTTNNNKKGRRQFEIGSTMKFNL